MPNDPFAEANIVNETIPPLRLERLKSARNYFDAMLEAYDATAAGPETIAHAPEKVILHFRGIEAKSTEEQNQVFEAALAEIEGLKKRHFRVLTENEGRVLTAFKNLLIEVLAAGPEEEVRKDLVNRLGPVAEDIFEAEAERAKETRKEGRRQAFRGLLRLITPKPRPAPKRRRP